MAITQAPPPSPAPIPPEPEEHAPGDHEMTLLEHLEELRGRLTKMVLALAAAVILVVIPIPGFNSVTGYAVDLIVHNATQFGVTVQAIGPGEVFFTYLEIALVIGAALAMPVIIFQVLAFVTPALYANEKRYLFIAVPGVFFSFVCGVVFCYFLTLPFATRFLAGFLAGTIEQNWTVEKYVDFVATFLFWVGVMFELPIVMFFLSKLGVVSHQRMASFRKYAFVLAFVIGAAITPTPDPINQTIISLPIYFLFELGVILARFA
jgi:sec-independent protein translocase protein TatC